MTDDEALQAWAMEGQLGLCDEPTQTDQAELADPRSRGRAVKKQRKRAPDPHQKLLAAHRRA